MKKIDSHHHFWRYDPVGYGWIDDNMSLIRRDFLPDELHREIMTAGIDAVVSVQARQCLDETDFLLGFAENKDFIVGVVGWVPMLEEGVDAYLERYADDPKFKAVRHVIQGEPDDDFILRPDFNRGVRALTPFDLTYDILVFEKHLSATIQFVDQHPGQRFVLDHIAKPRIKDSVLEPWKSHITELAKRENVWCKLSGLVTEADHKSWTVDQLKPFVETVLEAFGAGRLMFGSDWPVCLVACLYEKWVKTVMGFFNTLSAAEQQKIMGGNAAEAYKL